MAQDLAKVSAAHKNCGRQLQKVYGLLVPEQQIQVRVAGDHAYIQTLSDAF
jgi:hypothetical protein